MRKYTWKICALLALVLICLLGTKERVMAYSDALDRKSVV